MFGYIALTILLTGSIVGSWTDIKIREVSNWLSFGLIFSMLAIRLGQGIYLGQYGYLLEAATAGFLFLSLGVILFYSGQWGGADWKLLTAYGIGFGSLWGEFSPLFEPIWPFYLTLLMNILVVSVLYTLPLALLYALRNKKVLSKCRKTVGRNENLAMLLGFGASALAVSYTGESVLWVFSLLAPLYALSKFLKPIENTYLTKLKKINELVEFDIPVKDIKVGGKLIISSEGPNGMTLANLKQLKKLEKSKKIPGTMLVKWGFPLAPAFPIGLALSLIFGDFIIAFASL